MKLSDARRARLMRRTWYALRVEARKETAVALILNRRGFTAFVPTGWHPRRISSRQHKRIEFTGPILVRYVLVGFDRPVPWPVIRGASIHILGVVATDGTPSPLPARDMKLLFANHVSESLVPTIVQERPAQRKRFKRCRIARVLEGLLRGEVVSVEKVKGNKAEICLDPSPDVRPFVVPVDNLEPIE